MMKSTPGATAVTVARVCNISVSRVHALQQEPGWPPKIGPNEFDVQKFLLAYVRFIQQELKRRGPSGGPETAEILTQRARLLKAQVEQVEKRNAIDREEYVPAAAVLNVWSKRITNCRSRLLAIPTKLAMPLVNLREPSLIAEVLRREIYQALTELSSGVGIDESGDDGQDEAPSAAEEMDDFA
jgi:phage terminase Nu1 subunit (DNA packaging protein)